MADALDESWGRVPGYVAKAHGIKLIYGYLSMDPSKNLTAANVKDYHQHGIGVWLGWEQGTARPFDGFSAGTADANQSVGQLQRLFSQVGYRPANRLCVPFSLDQDISSGRFPAALPYYQAAKLTLGLHDMDAGAYAKMSFLDYLYGKGFTRGLFGPAAWSGGYISPHIALYQSQYNASLGGASIDYDVIEHAGDIGAWWPPGHPLNVAAVTVAPPTPWESFMTAAQQWWPTKAAFLADVAKAVADHPITIAGPSGPITAPLGGYVANADLYANQAMHALVDPNGPVSQLHKLLATMSASSSVDVKATAAAIAKQIVADLGGTPV